MIISLISCKSVFAWDTDWQQISKGKALVYFGDDFADIVVDPNNLTYEKDFGAPSHTKWEWIWNSSSGPTVAISFYLLAKDWFIYKDPVYTPRKRITEYFGVNQFKWEKKAQAFKSHERVAKYRKYTDTEYNSNCFIFGIHFAEENANYKQTGAPHGILDGYICRDAEFTKDEIKDIINSIGVKKLREIY
tara:strand:- start:164 stop:733 length:570 start_codon:yes stop_codon:yes gene_type:complete